MCEIKARQHERREVLCRKVGTHRRILFADLMRYKHLTEADRHGVLDQLTHDPQVLKMGY